MSDPLDVALRVRMRYEAGDGASKAITDVEKVRATAERLGASAAGGDRLGKSLRDVSGHAQKLERELAKVTTTATRLGAGDGATRLGQGLKDAAQAGSGATREITQLAQATARFGSVSTVSFLTRDLKAVHAPAQAVKRDLAEIRTATDRLGRGTGLRDLDEELQRASRRADDLERRLAGVQRRAAQRGRGDGSSFANEALMASRFGGGLRFGMGGAAAGGLVAGTAIAATAGGVAHATGQFIDFEHAMTQVKKAVNDTPAGMRELERDILRFSRVSGIAKTEVAGLVAQAGYLNVPRDQLQGFAEIATKASIGFEMRPEESGEALGHLRAAYKLKDNAELRSAADAINTIGDNVGARERNILNYLNRTSGTAEMLRIPLQKNAAIGGAIQSLGVAPDVAATGVQEVFGRLSNANLQGKEFQRGLRGIHMSGRQVKAMMDQDAVGGLLTVLERINQLQGGKKTNVIRDMFGEGEIATVSRMAESIDKIRSSLDLVSDSSRYQGSLERTFKIFNADTQAQIKRTEAAFESWAVKIGQKFSPAVNTAARAVERWFNAMNKAMERREFAEELAVKMTKGGALTPEEQAKVDANPRLKSDLDKSLFFHRQTDGIEASRQRLLEGPKPGDPAPPTMEDAREAFRKRAEEFERRRRGEDVPGTGKRSDLQDGLRPSLASFGGEEPSREVRDSLADYYDEVERSLMRTERLVRALGLRMTDELTLRPKIQDAAFRFGNGGTSIERASYGGGGLDSGAGGGGFGGGFGSGGGFGGGGAGSAPGRFGGLMPGAHLGGGRAGRGGGGGSGLTGPQIGTPGAGGAGPNLSGDAKGRAMQYYAGLRAGGLDAVHANALMGHAMQETGGSFKGDSWNARESAGGMLQYRGNRLENLKRFAAEQNKPWTDPYVQGQFASAEQRMDPYEAKRAKSFMGATDLDTASREAGKNVVRFGDSTGPYRLRMGRAFQDGSAYENLQGPAVAAADKLNGPVGSGAQRPGDHHGEGGVGTVLQRQQGGTRNQPITDRLMGQISKAAGDAGVSAEIYSGGQDAHGPHRTGSHRHDHGNSADLKLYETDASGQRRLLSMNNPQDREKMGLFIRKSVAHGATGVGAGPGYMGEHGIHIGGGSPLAWGAGGRAANAPDWVRGAHAAGMAEQQETMARDRALATAGQRTAPAARSPRFTDPSSFQLKPGAGGDQSSGAPGAGKFGLGGPRVTQNFHGGFDAHEVGRRAQLEQNREVRRTMAGALHDVGHPVTV